MAWGAGKVHYEEFEIGPARMHGMLSLPRRPLGLIIFAQSETSNFIDVSNNYLAPIFHKYNLGTLIVPLLSKVQAENRINIYDIRYLADKLSDITAWATTRTGADHMPLGYYATGTGSAAALMAAAETPHDVLAVVCGGGRPDLAAPVLSRIQAATLLIAAGRNNNDLGCANRVYTHLACKKEFVIVPRARFLAYEPAILDKVGRLAHSWFRTHFLVSKDLPHSNDIRAEGVL